MNRKGFTLVELLGVIVILAVILIIAAPNLLKIYKNSKLKSEEIFVQRISESIDSYIKLYGDEIEFNDAGFAKITMDEIIKSKIISEDDYINPGNKGTECYKDGGIEVYKNTNYVYCYKMEKRSLECLTDEYEKGFAIDTCPYEG